MANTFGLSGLKTLSGFSGVSQYFTLPSIGGLYKPQKLYDDPIKQKIMDAIFDMFKIGIPIYPDSYEENGSNNISEQVLVGGIGDDTTDGGINGEVGGLTKVADNIVVNPRTWRIHGYTGFNLNTTIGHMAQGGFTFGVKVPALLQSFINQFGRDVLNTVFKQTLQYIAQARRPFKFNTKEGETIPCLFKRYSIKSSPENANFIEIDLELQEFRFLALATNNNGQIAEGGVNSAFNPKKLGRSTLKALVM